MLKKEGEIKERPFEGKKVYFSGSISGAQDHTPDLFWNLVQSMKNGGAEVLSEHVGGKNLEEIRRIFSLKTGVNLKEVKEPWIWARKIDFKWVDEADYVVAEVTSPSLGVGMEIQRAIDKDNLGLKHTKILCLCRQDLIEKNTLSWMIMGVTHKEHQDFHLAGYTTVQEAKKIIYQFLTDSLPLK